MVAAAAPALDKLARLAALRSELARRGVLVQVEPEQTGDGAPAAPPPVERDAIATGLAALDALLPGGFPRRALTELLGPPACGKTSLIAPALAAVTAGGALAAFVDPAGEAYPPAFARVGVALPRMLWVRPPAPEGDPVDAMWAAEVLLQSGCFELVVLDAGALDLRPSRALETRARVLRAAAETHGAALVVVGDQPIGAPPALRLRVGADRRATRVTVEKSRWGRVGATASVARAP